MYRRSFTTQILGNTVLEPDKSKLKNFLETGPVC